MNFVKCIQFSCWGVMSALPLVPLFVDGTWLLLVSIKTTGDFQLLPTRCAMIQLAINRLRRMSSIHLAFLPT